MGNFHKAISEIKALRSRIQNLPDISAKLFNKIAIYSNLFFFGGGGGLRLIFGLYNINGGRVLLVSKQMIALYYLIS